VALAFLLRPAHKQTVIVELPRSAQEPVLV